MPRFRRRTLLLLLGLFGCANLMRAQAPAYTFNNVHLFGATAVAFSADGKVLASGGYRGEILLWDMDSKRQSGELRAHGDSIRALQFTADGKLASGGDDGAVVLWDLETRQPIVKREVTPVTSLILTGAELVSGHADGRVRLWWIDGLELVRELKLQAEVVSMAHNHDRIAVATRDGKITVYDLGLTQPREFDSTGGAAHDLHFSPDGKMLIGGGWFSLYRWDTATGKVHSVATEHNGLITSLDFSPDGRRLASVGRYTDSAIRVLRIGSFEVTGRYEAHKLCGAMIRFSPDGRYLATASDDTSVRLYDLSLPYHPR